MEAASRSPHVLTEITGNTSSDSFSTPEQDQGVVDSLTRTSLLAPKANRSRMIPIVKSKVDAKDADSNSMENGKYLVLHGNPSGQHALKIKKIITKKFPACPFPAAVCPRAEKILQKVEEGAFPFPKKTQHQVHPNQNRCYHHQCTKIPIRAESVMNTVQPTSTSGPPKEKITLLPPPPPRKVTKKIITKPEIPQKPPEKGKPYDPVQVKSFMEMQRGVRRNKERKELEERKLETERKRQHLLDLDHKRRDLIAKNRHSPKKIEPKDDPGLSLATKIYRARKAKSPSAAVTIPKILVVPPSTTKKKDGQHLSNDHREGSSETLAAMDAELRTTMILQEFESIVHRECLKLTSNQLYSFRGIEPSTSAKFDVGVETTTSLGEDEQKDSGKSPSTSKSQQRFRRSRDKASPSADQLHQLQETAATKIQAAFRGYKIRKIWREINDENFRRPARRMSFYRPRSTPSTESVRRRLPLLSPAHSPSRIQASVNLRPKSSSERSAFGMPVDFAPYIPPPQRSAEQLVGGSISGTEVREVPVPASVASRASLGGRRSNRFDEPFPKEAIKQLARQSPALGISPALSDHVLSFRDVSSPAAIQVNTAFIPGISELLHPSVPTFSMVLKEKVRLLQEMHQTSARKSGVTDDRTPVKRRPKVPLPRSDTTYYDSDSTQHASIVMSGGKYASASTSADVTITDDYIGPDEEAMQLAYNLRRSTRVSLENVENLPRDDDATDNDNNSTIPSNATFNTTTGTLDDGNYFPQTDEFSQFRKESMETFKRAVEGKNREVVAHAIEVSNQLGMREKVKERRQRSSPDRAMEKQVDALHQQVSAMDAKVAKLKNPTTEIVTPVLIPQQQHIRVVDNADFLLEFAKCQTESLKATAEIQQWVADLRRSSQQEIQETRHQETVNIAAAVYAAVEEAKKLAQPSQLPPPAQRQVVQAQGVQTTDSLLQNESLPNYSADGFLDTSMDDSHLKDDEILAPFKHAQRLEKGQRGTGTILVDHDLGTFKSQLENSISGRSDLSSTLDSIDSAKSSTSLTDIAPQKPSPVKPEKRVMVTFADVLREVKLLTPVVTETKGEGTQHQELIAPKAASISTSHDESKEELPTSLESNEVELEVSKNPESSTEFEEASPTSENSRSHSVVAEISEEKKDTLDQTIEFGDDNQSGEFISPTSKSLSSILEQPTASSHQQSVREDTPLTEVPEEPEQDIHQSEEPLTEVAEEPEQDVHQSEEPLTEVAEELEQDVHQSEELATSVGSESLKPAVTVSAQDDLDPVKQGAEVSINTSKENDEKGTLDESIAESEAEEFSYQSDFISNEASSLSPAALPDQVQLDQGETSESTGIVSQEESLIVAENEILGVEAPEPESESQKTSIEHKNTLDESIGSESLEEDEQISSAEVSALPEATLLPEALPVDDSPVSSVLANPTEVDPETEEDELQKSPVKDSRFIEPMEQSISSPEDLLPAEEAKIPVMEELDGDKENEPVAIEVTQDVPASATELATAVPEVIPTEDMLLDMMELSEYRDEHGFPVRKPWRKWCVRERDIVDHVLVGEILDENRSWTDLNSEIAEVTENLVESISRRAFHESMAAITKVMKH